MSGGDTTLDGPAPVVPPANAAQEAVGAVPGVVIRPHLVLPAYNEAASLPPLLERLRDLAAAWGEHMTVWVVDDGSTDGTGHIALQGHAGLDVRVVTHPLNLGLGQAVHSGLRAAIADAGEDDAIVIMD